MRTQITHRALVALALPLTLLTLWGCGEKPVGGTMETQKAKEQDARQQMKSAFETDPTFRKSGSSNTPVPGSNVTPVAVPGANGPMPSPNMTPGGR